MRAHVVLTLALSVIAAAGDPAAADDVSGRAPRKSFREAFRTFTSDGRYLVTFPARISPKGAWLTAGVVAATALVMNQDEEIRDDVLETDREAAGRIARKFEPLGRYEVEAAALGTLYLVGRRVRNEHATSTAATAFESYLWAAIITSVAKGAFGRERPGKGSGEGAFFAGDTIFPSGHTTRSFAIAAVFVDRYGRKSGFIAYPVAALVGLATIQEDRHWASDVVAGAGLGLAIGKGIASRHPRASLTPTPGATWNVVPRPGGAALRIIF